MAHFNQPAVHNVERTKARVISLSDSESICLELQCAGMNCFQEEAEVTFDLFFPRTSETYARALAAAINAVPAPETTSE
jgi:hypothetical protein